MKAGNGKMVGRRSTFPSVLVKPRFVTGFGATALAGPCKLSLDKRVIDAADDVIKRDPVHPLAAAADPAAQPEAEGREHLRQRSTLRTQDHSES